MLPICFKQAVITQISQHMIEMEMSVIQNNSTANYSGEISTTEDPDYNYWYEYYTRQGVLLNKYAFPIFFFIGLVGNILSIILIMKGTLKHMSSGVYLLFLAVADLFICALGIADWLPRVAMDYVITDHEAVCKTIQFFSKVLEQTSSWMIVAITVERAVVLIRPRHALLLTTRRMAWIITAAIVTTLVLINIRQPFIAGIIDEGGCHYIKEIDEHLTGIPLALLDLLIYSFIPSIILIACNVSLAVRLNKQHKDSLIEESKENVKNNKKQITAMVIALTFVFVVLTLPYSCFMISDFVPPDILWVPNTRELWFDIVKLLVVVNHSINIFLYFLIFRQDFWDMFKCGKLCHKTRIEEDVIEGNYSLSTIM